VKTWVLREAITAVAVGVILANDWRERRRNRSQEDLALESLVEGGGAER